MEILNELKDRLLIAIPKKGRLHEKCLTLLDNIDIQFHRKPRHDIALAKNLPVAILFLPAADIAKYVAKGNVSLGITGQDIIAESEVEEKINVELKLGFGRCKLQLQVPIKEKEIIEPAHVAGKRIVTSFPNLSKAYFNSLNSQVDTKVEFVSGSVEVACTLGLAEGIVDLVESGETMKAAGLHAIGTIMESEAVLLSNPKSPFQPLIRKLKDRIEGSLLAKKYVVCTYNILRTNLEKAKKITPGRLAPSVSPLEDLEWVAVSSMVLKQNVAEVMDMLKEVGASDIMVTMIANCRA
ncbi:ATP phosphoribosyltransferase [Neoconidiobolus thromboides FSU 785]|nr:ATP phosphoribosyltransferase [Neoconidiobolus thromboides FSU 785]